MATTAEDLSSALTETQFKEVQQQIIDELGFEPIKTVGYHIAILIADNKSEKNFEYIDPETGQKVTSKLLMGNEGAEEKFNECVGKVIYMGKSSYKTGKFRRDRSFSNFNSYAEFMSACETLESSRFCPERYKGKLADVCAAVEIGMRHDFSPVESLMKVDFTENNIPYIKEKDEIQESVKNNVFSFIREIHLEPWCQLGDYIVVPRHEGPLISYRGKAVMIVPDDRILAVVDDPAYVKRF